ncbi:MAG: hypothetical protein RR835_13870 [Peptostreptococcaceae bacterium]
MTCEYYRTGCGCKSPTHTLQRKNKNLNDAVMPGESTQRAYCQRDGYGCRHRPNNKNMSHNDRLKSDRYAHEVYEKHRRDNHMDEPTTPAKNIFTIIVLGVFVYFGCKFFGII